MKRWVAVLLVPLLGGCTRHFKTPPAPVPASVSFATLPMNSFQKAVVEGLRDQLNWGTGYDASYREIPYPDGDVPKKMGACTDVVIRAYRHAGIDLQQLIHDDIACAWASYPHMYKLSGPNPNIDHRRVPNQRVYFERHWKWLTTDKKKTQDWEPGDVVEWRMPDKGTHTGVLTERLDNAGLPCVIENLGSGPEEDDALATDWEIIGHFRYQAPRQKGRKA